MTLIFGGTPEKGTSVNATWKCPVLCHAEEYATLKSSLG